MGVPVNSRHLASVFLGPRAAGGFLALEAVAVIQRLSLAGNTQVRGGQRVRGRFLGSSSAAHLLIMNRLFTYLHTNSSTPLTSSYLSSGKSTLPAGFELCRESCGVFAVVGGPVDGWLVRLGPQRPTRGEAVVLRGAAFHDGHLFGPATHQGAIQGRPGRLPVRTRTRSQHQQT